MPRNFEQFLQVQTWYIWEWGGQSPPMKLCLSGEVTTRDSSILLSPPPAPPSATWLSLAHRGKGGRWTPNWYVHISWGSLGDVHFPTPIPHTNTVDVDCQVRQRTGIWLWLPLTKREWARKSVRNEIEAELQHISDCLNHEGKDTLIQKQSFLPLLPQPQVLSMLVPEKRDSEIGK